MRTLIVGMGQVGRALYKVLEPHYLTCAWPDTSKWMRCSGIMHICFPYSEDFEGEVKSYQEKLLTTQLNNYLNTHSQLLKLLNHD